MKKSLLIGAVMVLVIIGAIMFSQKDKNADSGLLIGPNAINVTEQVPSSEVRISMVVLEDKGYVVIHKIFAGVPADVIGASALLPKGKSENTPVSLSSPLLLGQEYTAMLHLDDSDGVFDATVDLPVQDPISGGPVMMQFEVSATGGSGRSEHLVHLFIFSS